MFGLLFSNVKVMHIFLQNMCWATFWAIFLQTHLVTLLGRHENRAFTTERTFFDLDNLVKK
jgi:hypothetical protein